MLSDWAVAARQSPKARTAGKTAARSNMAMTGGEGMVSRWIAERTSPAGRWAKRGGALRRNSRDPASVFPYTPYTTGQGDVLMRVRQLLLVAALAATSATIAAAQTDPRPRSRYEWRSERPHIHFRFGPDRKSTRLNSSHGYISYAVFCY